METSRKIDEARNFYKDRYPSRTVMFRVGDDYMAYDDDATKIRNALGYDGTPQFSELRVPQAEIFDVVRKCSESGLSVMTVSYRDDDGEFAIPDVMRLKAEAEMDY